MIVVEVGSSAAAPKGSMTYAFTQGNFFLLLLLLLLHRPPSHQPPGPLLSLKAHIPASKPKSQSWGPHLSRLRGPWRRDFGLEVGIWPSRLEFGPWGQDMILEAGIWAWRLGGGTKQKKGKEKISLCESIGHRPLRGRCPKSGKMSV